MTGAGEKVGRRGRLAGAVAWAALLLAVMLVQARQRAADPSRDSPDELYWIGSAYYFDLLTRGEIHHPDWQLLPARENPPVGKYLFGLALRARGQRVRNIDLIGRWLIPFLRVGGPRGDPRDREKRLEIVRRMSPAAASARFTGTRRPLSRADLSTCRGLILGVGLLTALGIGAIGRRAGGPWTGRVASLAFVLHPVAVGAYSQVLVDIIALAFSTLAVRALIALLEGTWGGEAPRPPGRRLAFYGGLEGLALGLACGSKMNAMVVVLVAGGAWGGLMVRSVRVGGRRCSGPAVGLGLAFVLAAVVFAGVNPTLYPDPLGGVRALFEEPARTIRLQASFLPDHAAAPAAKLRVLADLLAGGWPGLAPLLAVAAWRTGVAVREPGPRRVVVLWWWVALAAVGLWIPFPWERYALPLVPPAALLVADGATAGARGVARAVGGLRAARPAD